MESVFWFTVYFLGSAVMVSVALIVLVLAFFVVRGVLTHQH